MKIRDKEAFVLFVFGISLSFFIVINGAHLLNAWYNQMTKSQDESSYRNSVTFVVDRNDDKEALRTNEDGAGFYQYQLENASKLLEQLAAQEVTTYIKDIHLPVGATAEYQPVNVIVSGNGEWYRTLRTGHYPSASEWQKNGKMAVINENAEKYVELIDGQRVIKIGGENYQILGQFETYQVSEDEVDITIYYVPERETDILHHRLAIFFYETFDMGITMCIGSNFGNVTEQADALFDVLEADGYLVTPENSTEQETGGIEKFYARIRGLTLLVLFLVSLITCREITGFWITRKKMDLIIWKTFGMCDRQIILRVLMEFLQMLTASLVLVVCIDGIYQFFSGIHIEMRSILRNAVLLFTAFLIMMAVAILPILRTVHRVIPAEGLRGE